MHVQSCDFAENNYFFDVVIVLSSGRSRGGGAGGGPPPPPPPPPRYPKDWIHHSLLYQVKLFRVQIRNRFVLQH